MTQEQEDQTIKLMQHLMSILSEHGERHQDEQVIFNALILTMVRAAVCVFESPEDQSETIRKVAEVLLAKADTVVELCAEMGL